MDPRITALLEYAIMCGPSPGLLSTEVLDWLSTTLAAELKRKPNKETHELEHLVDYLTSADGPKKLKRMSYSQAMEKANAWTKAQQKKGKNIEDGPKDIEVIHDFLDGNKIVKLLSKAAYQREGFLMSHCVGGYDPKTATVYSYRDAKNQPHATFEVAARIGLDEMYQIKGKGNGPIHPKYINHILVFLNILGIKIRPSEMINLGYAHVPKGALSILHMFVDTKGKAAPLAVLSGENYIYVGS